MKQWVLYLILAIACILEGTITTLPLVLISFLILMIFLRAKFLFWLALLIGLLMDILLVRELGMTSVILVLFLLIVLLYENKFEASTNYFIIISSFIGSLIYLLALNIQHVLIQSVFVAFLAWGIFKLLMHSEIKKPKYKIDK